MRMAPLRSVLHGPFLGTAAIIFLDQATKYWAERALGSGKIIPIIGNHVGLSLAHNTGAAFGLLRDSRLLLTLMAAIAAIIIAAYGRLFAAGRFRTIAMAMILGGALGNLIDRVRFGHVIDFIASTFWPTFNVADIAITVGAVLLAYNLCFTKKNDNNSGAGFSL